VPTSPAARRALELAQAAGELSYAVAPDGAAAKRVLLRLTGHARDAFGMAGRLVRGRGDELGTQLRSTRGDEAAVHRDQRAS